MKYLFLILLVLFSLNCFSQNAFSPRIGNEIDKYEREYFGLFPAIKGFHFASTMAGQDSSIDVKITRKIDGNLSDTTYQISKEIVRNLSIYIEYFEACRSGKYQVDWVKFNGLAAVNSPFRSLTNEPTEITISNMNNNYFQGIILYADDSTLVLKQNNLSFNYENIDKSITFFKAGDIKEVTKVNTGNTLKGLLYGALIAGGIAVGTVERSSSYIGPTVFSFGLLGALIGTPIGALLDIDKEFNNYGAKKFNTETLYYLQTYSIYSAYPPPEVMKLMK